MTKLQVDHSHVKVCRCSANSPSGARREHMDIRYIKAELKTGVAFTGECNLHYTPKFSPPEATVNTDDFHLHPEPH